MKRRTMNFIAWPVRVLLALGFLIASLGKLTINPAVVEMFQIWGYPAWFAMLIGILELAGAILLLIPKFSRYASYGLMIIMVGALITHLMHDPIANIIRPGVFMVLLGLNLWMTFKLQSPLRETPQ